VVATCSEAFKIDCNAAKLEITQKDGTVNPHDFSSPQQVETAVRGTKVCRYNGHSAGSLGWPFPVLKYEYIFQIKYTEATLSNSTRKLLRFEITEMLIAV